MGKTQVNEDNTNVNITVETTTFFSIVGKNLVLFAWAQLVANDVSSTSGSDKVFATTAIPSQAVQISHADFDCLLRVQSSSTSS